MALRESHRSGSKVGDGGQREPLHGDAGHSQQELKAMEDSSIETAHCERIPPGTESGLPLDPRLEDLRKRTLEKGDPFFEDQLEIFMRAYELEAELGMDAADEWLKSHCDKFKSILNEPPADKELFNQELLFGSPLPVRNRDKSILDREVCFYLENSRWISNRFDCGLATEGIEEESEKTSYGFEGCGFKKEDLDEYVKCIKNHLDEKKVMKNCSVIDAILMSDVVDLENKINPGINAYYIDDASRFNEKLSEIFERQVGKGGNNEEIRFLVNVGMVVEYRKKPGTHRYLKFFRNHFCAFDIRKIKSKLSIIALEPASYAAGGSVSNLKAKVMRDVRKNLPGTHMLFVDLDVQKSTDECGIFSLSFLRKSFSKRDEFAVLHAQNIEGKLARLAPSVLREKFPIGMMKHAHSKTRIESYLRENEGLIRQLVNKRDENLKERFNRLLALRKIDGRSLTYSSSIEFKRLEMIGRLNEEVQRREQRKAMGLISDEVNYKISEKVGLPRNLGDSGNRVLTVDLKGGGLNYLPSRNQEGRNKIEGPARADVQRDFRKMKMLLKVFSSFRSEKPVIDTYTMFGLLRKKDFLISNEFSVTVNDVFDWAKARYATAYGVEADKIGFIFTSAQISRLEEARRQFGRFLDSNFLSFPNLRGADELVEIEDEEDVGFVDVYRSPSDAVLEKLGLVDIDVLEGAEGYSSGVDVWFDGQDTEVELPLASLMFWGEYLFRSGEGRGVSERGRVMIWPN